MVQYCDVEKEKSKLRTSMDASPLEKEKEDWQKNEKDKRLGEEM